MNNDARSIKLRELIEKKVEVLYEEAPCGFIFTDPEGNILKINKTFLDWTGHNEKELINVKKLQDLLAIGSKIYYETNYAPLLRMQGFLNEITLDLKTKSGERLPVLINSAEIRDENEAPLIVKSTIFNISERRRYEKELLAARSRAEKAARRLELLAKAGESLRESTDYNKTLKKVADLAVESFCDLCAIDLLEEFKFRRLAEARNFEGLKAPTLDLPSWDLPQAFFIEDVDSATDLEPAFKKSIYELEPQSLIIQPIKLNGKFIGAISFYITQLGRRFSEEDLEMTQELSQRIGSALNTALLEKEKEQAHQDLLESRDWFSTTLRSIGDAVLVINPDETVDYLNPMAERLTGWPLVEAYGRHMDDVFNIVHAFTGEKAFNPVEKVLEEGTVIGLANNTSLIRKDGSQIIIEDSASPLKGGDGKIKGVVLVFKDTTKKHLEEVEKNNLLENLKKERELRENFIATLTHDLQSPLMASKLNIEMLETTKSEDSETKFLCEKAIQNIERTEAMIQDLLDVNRVKAGEIIPMKIAQFDMVPVVKEATSNLTQIHGDRFILDLPSSLYGFWSKEGVRRILENLCNNAVKYGTSDTPVTIKLTRQNKAACLSVHNEGNPIPQEEQEILFDLYKRSSSATSGDQKGWGLGLSLVKGVAEGLGGKAEVKSSDSKGTTFTVLLPIDAR